MSVEAVRVLWPARWVAGAALVSMGYDLNILGGRYSPQERPAEEDGSRQ